MADSIKLEINGKTHQLSVDPEVPLLYVLRENLDLTGTKYGCGEGQCGACTVMVDGLARRSCLTPVGSVAGKRITTIEGLAPNNELHPLQQAFWDADAFQCSYCTSGMIVAAAAFLKTNPNPSEAQIAHALNGNVCRCGTHPRIIAAVQKAAEAMREKS